MPFLRVVIGGRMVGAQRWSIGHTMNTTAVGASNSVLVDYAEACFSAFKAQVWNGAADGALRQTSSSATTCDSVRVYLYPGPDQPAVQIGASTGAAVSGSVTGTAAAPQLAIVATLEDGLAGRAHKGRMYLPAPAVQTGVADYLLPVSFAQGLATRVANYLTAVRAISFGPDGPLQPIVSSATSANPITRVTVDTVIDTQRRRRDKVVGTRVGASLVVG